MIGRQRFEKIRTLIENTNGFRPALRSAIRLSRRRAADRLKGQEQVECRARSARFDLPVGFPPLRPIMIVGSQVLNHAERLRDEAGPETNRPYKSLRGLWADLHVSLSAEEIDANQSEMWRDFPRQDI